MFKRHKLLFLTILIVFSSYSQEKQLNDSINQNILKEVIITGTKTIRNLSSLPLPALIITQKEIENSNSTRLSEILNEQAGLITIPDFGGGEGIQLQGLDSQYTLILIDGLPIIGRSAGTLDINRFSTGNIKQIEIVKGASSSLYGSEAIGGVINIITKRPVEGFDSDLSYYIGSNNTNDANLLVNYKKNKIGFTLFANSYKSDGYDLDENDELNTVEPFKNYTINSKATFDFSKKLSIAINGRYFDQVQDYIASTELLGESSIKEWNLSLTGNLRSNDKWNNSIELYKTNYYADEYLNTADGENYTTNFYDHNLIHSEVKSIYKPKANSTYVFGLWYNNETLERTYFTTRPEFKSPYAYIQYDYNPKDNLNVIIGGRYDSHNEYKSQFSPKSAVRYEINDQAAIKGSLGYGYKAPDFRQLYFNFNNATVGYTVLGYNAVSEVLPQLVDQGQIANIVVPLSEFSDKLQAESSIALNIGTDVKFSSEISTDFNLFYNNITNLIDTRVIANKINGQNVFSYYNINEVITYGLEINSSYKPNNNFKISAGYQLLFAFDKEGIRAFNDGEVYARETPVSPTFQLEKNDYFGLYNRSRHMGYIKLFYENYESKFNGNIRLTYRSKYGLYDTNNNTYLDVYDDFVKGYVIADLALNKEINNYSKIGFGINNLFNFKDINNISNISGRIYYSKINIQLW